VLGIRLQTQTYKSFRAEHVVKIMFKIHKIGSICLIFLSKLCAMT